ncbi:MAG: hypothetical protein RLY21_19 [Planctomycetota bacterium]|jgi:hypothetical protein
MNLQKIRFALALPAGILVMAAFTGLFESLGTRLFELPQSMLDAKALMQQGDPGWREAIGSAMHDMPIGALVSVVLAWVLGAALGAFAACRVGGANFLPLSIAVGAVSVAFVAMNLILIPHPLWMSVAGVLLPPAAALGVGRLAVDWMPRARSAS